MKRTLYTMPAVMVVLFYGMLAILSGGFSGFQARAWLMILLPVAAAVLLVAGNWWGSIFGMAMGGLMLSIGMMGENQFILLFGAVAFVYYLVMGIICLKDVKKSNT